MSENKLTTHSTSVSLTGKTILEVVGSAHEGWLEIRFDDGTTLHCLLGKLDTSGGCQDTVQYFDYVNDKNGECIDTYRRKIQVGYCFVEPDADAENIDWNTGT